MLSLVRKWNNKRLKKKNEANPNICMNCIAHKDEELFNMPIVPHVRFCGLHRKYTSNYDTCKFFTQELFEATANSTQTEELSLELDLSIEKDKLMKL